MVTSLEGERADTVNVTPNSHHTSFNTGRKVTYSVSAWFVTYPPIIFRILFKKGSIDFIYSPK